MKELSKNLKCVKVGNIEIWVEAEKIESLLSIIGNKNAETFVQIGDEVVNRSHITGIFTPKAMEEATRRKNGEWQCKWGYLHERGERCAHGDLAKYN